VRLKNFLGSFFGLDGIHVTILTFLKLLHMIYDQIFKFVDVCTSQYQ